MDTYLVLGIDVDIPLLQGLGHCSDVPPLCGPPKGTVMHPHIGRGQPRSLFTQGTDVIVAIHL